MKIRWEVVYPSDVSTQQSTCLPAQPERYFYFLDSIQAKERSLQIFCLHRRNLTNCLRDYSTWAKVNWVSSEKVSIFAITSYLIRRRRNIKTEESSERCKRLTSLCRVSRASRLASSARRTWSPVCWASRSRTPSMSAPCPTPQWSSSAAAPYTRPRCACRTSCSRSHPGRRCPWQGPPTCPDRPTKFAQKDGGQPWSGMCPEKKILWKDIDNCFFFGSLA